MKPVNNYYNRIFTICGSGILSETGTGQAGTLMHFSKGFQGLFRIYDDAGFLINRSDKIRRESHQSDILPSGGCQFKQLFMPVSRFYEAMNFE